MVKIREIVCTSTVLLCFFGVSVLACDSKKEIRNVQGIQRLFPLVVKLFAEGDSIKVSSTCVNSEDMRFVKRSLQKENINVKVVDKGDSSSILFRLEENWEYSKQSGKDSATVYLVVGSLICPLSAGLVFEKEECTMLLVKKMSQGSSEALPELE